MSVRQRNATLFKYSRPKEEVTKDSTTTGRTQDPDGSSRHQQTYHTTAQPAAWRPMLRWLPSQGTVFNLLPLLSSPHRYIFLIAGKLRGNYLFFFPDLGVHVNEEFHHEFIHTSLANQPSDDSNQRFKLMVWRLFGYIVFKSSMWTTQLRS